MIRMKKEKNMCVFFTITTAISLNSIYLHLFAEKKHKIIGNSSLILTLERNVIIINERLKIFKGNDWKN